MEITIKKANHVHFSVCILRGAPAVGKSTVGRALLEYLGEGAIVEIDKFRSMIANCDWQNRQHHEIGMRAALQSLRSYNTDGLVPVVLIDTFGRDRLSYVQNWLDTAFISHITFSLWLNPSFLRERIDNRVTGYINWEMSRLLNEEVANIRFPREYFIDMTGLSIKAVVEMVMQGLTQVGTYLTH